MLLVSGCIHVEIFHPDMEGTYHFGPDRPFWLRFELRAADQKDLSSLIGDSGISLSVLIDLFSGSRKPGANDAYFKRDAGPFRLSDLPRISSGRGRIG